MLSLILQIVWKVKVRKCFLKRLSSVSKMLLLMLTFWDEFRSLIQSCILRVKVEVLIFTDAELTYFSHRIVRSSSQSPIWCCGECCPLWEAWHTHWGWCLCAPHSQCWCQTCAGCTWFMSNNKILAGRVDTLSNHKIWAGRVDTMSNHKIWARRVDTLSNHKIWVGRVDPLSNHKI